MRFVRITASFLFVSAILVAQTHPSATEILQKVSAVYQAAHSYELVGTTTPPGRFLLAFQAPDKYRIEGHIPGMLAEMGSGVTGVFDGKNLHFYFPEKKQYGVMSLEDLTSGDVGDGEDALPENIDKEMMSRYRDAGKTSAGEAEFVQETTFDPGSGSLRCYVVRMKDKGDTWWVDAKTFRVVRQDDAKSSVIFSTILLNQPLSPDLFRFSPPPGATELKRK